MSSSTLERMSHAERYERGERMAAEVRSGKSIPQVACDFRVGIETVRRACKQHNMRVILPRQ